MRKIQLAAMLGAAMCCDSVAQAQVFMKSTGRKAVPIRVQKLNATVTIAGNIAVTEWTMEFPMERVDFAELYSYTPGGLCDFIMARPSDAKVTSFKFNELPGRVVEKSAIQRVGFRAVPNDPLRRSGLNANNSFRVTIYPTRFEVGQWSDVKVQGTWVQVLPTKGGRANYRLPLLSLRGATQRLKELNVSIKVRNSHVQNNYGLPQSRNGSETIIRLNQRNFRVLRDLAVTTSQMVSDSGVLLAASNVDGSGGHFALSLPAGGNWTKPKLSTSGNASLTSVLPPDRVSSGERALFVGTYTGNFHNLNLYLTVGGTTRVHKVAKLKSIHAKSLWATQMINVLAASPSNRSRIIELSKHYLVSSPYTDWLGIDDTNFRIYRHVKADAQLSPLVREYWVHYASGREKTRRSVALRGAITKISHYYGLNPADELMIRFGGANTTLVWLRYDLAGRRKLSEAALEKREERLDKQRVAYLTSLNDVKPMPKEYGGGLDARGSLYGLRTAIVSEYRKPYPDYKKLNALELHFARLYGVIDHAPRYEFWVARAKSQEVDEQMAAVEKTENSDKTRELLATRADISRQVYFVNNIGDPPIYVSAPADAKQVIALMPDGKIKTLDYNAEAKRWEGNYDVPTTTAEGDYSIQIVIVLADNSRRRYATKFRVDTTAPTGQGRVFAATSPAPPESPLHLEVEHSGDVARVTALLPWGERVALLPSTKHGKRFFGSVQPPKAYAGKAVQVKYILIDKAHNLTTIEAESTAP